MKSNTLLLIAITGFLSLSGCRSYWEYQKAKKKGEITTQSEAYKLFKAELDSILADQMSSYRTQAKFEVENKGFFKVTNISEEQAPYIVGQLVTLKGKSITQDQLPNLLIDVKHLDTKIKFDAPEVSMFINKSASINVDALNVVKGSMDANEKMKIEYNKAFVATPQRNWFNQKLWEQTITKYGLTAKDSLWVVSNVQVKRFTYSIYEQISGQFSATPTPVVAIEGSAFQESGGERNVYEVFIQLNRVRYPVEANTIVARMDSVTTEKGAETLIIPFADRMQKAYLQEIKALDGQTLKFKNDK